MLLLGAFSTDISEVSLFLSLTVYKVFKAVTGGMNNYLRAKTYPNVFIVMLIHFDVITTNLRDG